MLKHIYIPSFNFLFLISFGLFVNSSYSNADEQILVRVNGENITADMMSVLQDSRHKGPLSELDQNKNELLESLITTELLFNEAKKAKLDANKQISLELELAHKTLLSQFYVRNYMDQLSFDDAILKSVYDAKAPKAMVRMAYWFFDSAMTANAFLTKVKSGHALALPPGEELPWEALENYPFASLPETKNLSDGQWISKPLEDQGGWLVWRCLETSAIPKPSFEDSHEGIRQELATQKLQEHIKNLRAQADIQNFLQDK